MMPRPSAGPLDTATAVSAPAPAFEIDAAALADISRVTGGSTYIARDPSEISEVFVNALAHRGT